MYLNRAEDKNKKMTDRWKADADGILIFVSVHLIYSHINLESIDRSFFSCGCDVYWSLHPGPQSKLPGYLRILSCKYLSDTCRR